MSVGLIFFTLADTKLQPNFEIYGVVVICFALVADAIIGNVQEKVMKLNDSSNVEMVLYSYAIGFVYLFVVILINGQLWDAIEFSSLVSTA